jgi:hypothetical protein
VQKKIMKAREMRRETQVQRFEAIPGKEKGQLGQKGTT